MCDGLPKAEEHGHINRILRSKDKAEPCRVSPSAPIKPMHHPMCGFYLFTQNLYRETRTRNGPCATVCRKAEEHGHMVYK